jgi:hypothetical protein
MRSSTKMAAGIAVGLLISVVCAPALAELQDPQSPAETTEVTTPCAPLSWAAGNKLPWFIKPSQVECMSPTPNDLRARIQAGALLVKAIAQMQSDRAMSRPTAETAYEDGFAAYSSGRYIEAIAHLQAALPSTK